MCLLSLGHARPPITLLDSSLFSLYTVSFTYLDEAIIWARLAMSDSNGILFKHFSP